MNVTNKEWNTKMEEVKELFNIIDERDILRLNRAWIMHTEIMNLNSFMESENQSRKNPYNRVRESFHQFKGLIYNCYVDIPSSNIYGYIENTIRRRKDEYWDVFKVKYDDVKEDMTDVLRLLDWNKMLIEEFELEDKTYVRKMFIDKDYFKNLEKCIKALKQEVDKWIGIFGKGR